MLVIGNKENVFREFCYDVNFSNHEFISFKVIGLGGTESCVIFVNWTKSKEF